MNVKIYTHDEVRAVRRLHRSVIDSTTDEMTVSEQLRLLSDNLYSEFADGNTATTVEIKNWHPDLVGKSAEEILASEFTPDDARLVIARGYGFIGWNDALENGAETFDMVFEHAIDTMLNGNLDLLQKKVEKHGRLLRARSKYGHRATILHYVSSNGIEIRRQKVPLNLVEITEFLLVSGADRNAKANLYGGAYTALELAATSAHPKDAGISEDLIRALKID